MNKFMNWVTESLTPKLNKFSQNVWVSSIQESIYSVMPMILFGSIISMLNLIQNFIPEFPDLSLLNQFSFGLFGLFVAFLFPYYVLEKKELSNFRVVGGLTSIGLFLIFLFPQFGENGTITLELGRFGGGGMMCSFFAGAIVSIAWIITSKIKFIGDESVLPDFIAGWFQSLLPISISLVLGFVLTSTLQIDIFIVIGDLFQPLFASVQTLPGFIFVMFTITFFYSLGISTHVFNPFLYPALLLAIEQNAANHAIGQTAENIVSWEPVFAFTNIGGAAMQLSLCLLFIFMAKSKRLKAIGKATVAPALFNINEPLLYGTPVVFNPILMIPMWIVPIVMGLTTYLALQFGLVPIATQINLMGQMPPFIYAFIVYGVPGVILAIVNFVIAGAIYYPFFKVYDKQLLVKELSGKGKNNGYRSN